MFETSVFFELVDVKEQASTPIVPLHVKHELGGYNNDKRTTDSFRIK